MISSGRLAKFALAALTLVGAALLETGCSTDTVFPAVHDMPAARNETTLTPAEVKQATDSLVTERDHLNSEAQATGNPQACYCGTASDAGCLGGSANGACKAQYEAAAGTTDVNTITGGFVDPATVFGRVDNEVTCDGDTTSTPSCTMVCPL